MKGQRGTSTQTEICFTYVSALTRQPAINKVLNHIFHFLDIYPTLFIALKFLLCLFLIKHMTCGLNGELFCFDNNQEYKVVFLSPMCYIYYKIDF